MDRRCFSRLTTLIGLLCAVIVLAACAGGATPTPESPDIIPADFTPVVTVIPSDDLIAGTPITISDQEYEMLWQELRANIRADHEDVYAAVGPWVHRFPERRPCLVALTVDPLPIVQQYEAGRRLLAAGELELRIVEYTDAQLEAVQDGVNRAIGRHRAALPQGFISMVSHDRNLNRVVVEAIDPATVVQAALDRGYQIPPQVIIARPDWLSAEDAARAEGGAFTYTNAQGEEIVYLMHAMSIGPSPPVLMMPPYPEVWGKLSEAEGCLRFVPDDGGEIIVPIWWNPSRIEVSEGRTVFNEMVVGESVAIHFSGAGEGTPEIYDARCPGSYQSVFRIAYKGDSYALPPDVTATASPTITPTP